MLTSAPEVVCLDSKELGRAAALSYGARSFNPNHKMPGTEVAIRVQMESVAKAANLGYCKAHKASPLFEGEDVDENVIWHLALEVELMKKAVSK